ncbi:MAG: MMPL family transporter [Parvibaculum sp.]|uniref:MMPL family transporter n=1 Tax=Parvibaculum sp. TaxID=2024848 RepID=UPI0025D30B7C|nr:MMPL family transporter [Parvibaculum sp.]MCE9650890.1 MMPL family transporter [Parvibaculum sp.]
MSGARLAALAAILVFLAAGLFVANRISGAVDTDILSLLPGDARDPVLVDAMQRASLSASSRIAFAIEGGEAQQRHEAAAALSALLAETVFFEPSSSDAKGLWQWLFAHRASLLCADDRELLKTGHGGEIAQAALLKWYAPMGMGNSHLLQADPFLLTNRLLECLVPQSIRTMPKQSAEIVSGGINQSAFRLDVQDKISAAVESWKVLPISRGLSLSRAGAVFHAAYGAEHARAEMRVISAITTIFVLLLYWMMFRSLRAPLIALAMVLYSLTIGLAATLAVFGGVHAMGLVFGAALIGMVVDYTTYYLVTGLGMPGGTVAERRAHILKPLTLGMLTSVGAFAALLFFPVTAFRQIAVLGGVGLIAAWVATLYLTPLLERGAMRKGPGAEWIARVPGQFLARSPSFSTSALIIAICVALTAVGFAFGTTLDDVRRLQAPSSQLAKEEKQVRSLTGFVPSGAFFVVHGDSVDETAEHEQALIARLEAQGDGGSIVWAASSLDPSATRKREDANLIATKLIAPHLSTLISQLGSSGADAYQTPPQAADLPALASALRGRTGETYWSIVPVAGAVTSDVEDDFVQFVDPAGRYSALLKHYRLLAMLGLGASVAATGLALVLAYKRLAALRIMLPTVMSLVVTPAITALFGLPFSFFSVMGLFLVVGAGVDYAIFQWEHPREEGVWTRVGIVLAAAMTCISVGLLGLSSVLPVKSFGLTVAVGILLSLVLSPLVRGWGYGRPSGDKS